MFWLPDWHYAWRRSDQVTPVSTWPGRFLLQTRQGARVRPAQPDLRYPGSVGSQKRHSLAVHALGQRTPYV